MEFYCNVPHCLIGGEAGRRHYTEPQTPRFNIIQVIKSATKAP
jgi:hypothetical protein